jgi:DNA-binding beta-propeller fold protein YncE
VDTEGRVRTLAGGPGKAGHQDGPAETARFKSPHGVAVRKDGAIAVAEVGNDTIRLLLPGAGGTWTVSTLAGRAGHSGMKDGPCAEARFSSPHAVAWGPRGELYVADIGNARLRMVEGGRVTTVAGDGRKGWIDGAPGRLSWPMDLSMDAWGTLWIADCGALTLRTWSPARGLGTPFPGLRLAMPHGLSVQDGKVFVAEMNGQRILAFDERTGAVATLFGTGARGFAPGQLNRPAAVLSEGTRLWVADLYNHRVLALEP